MTDAALQSIIALAAVAGFFVARHIWAKKRRDERFLCPIGFDCDKVVHSRFSTLFGVHLEVFGMLYYGAIALAYGLFLAFPALYRGNAALATLVASAAAFLFSLYLTGVQLFALKEWCSWCLVSAALCVTIFFSALALVG